MFYLNIMDYSMVFLLLSTRNEQGHLSDTEGPRAGIWTMFSQLDPLKVMGWVGGP